MSTRPLRRVVAVPLLAVLLFQLTGCGTLLYPERRGQPPGGRFDSDVVLLDAVGLLFFVVPGVIAFAVDILTGAIYLPKGKRSRTSQLLGELQIEEHRLDGRSAEAVAAAVLEHAGIAIDLRDAVRIPAEDGEDLEARLLALNQMLVAAEARPASR